MTVYVATNPHGEKLYISADLAQASAAIMISDTGEEFDWTSTPLQTADTEHTEDGLLDVVNGWLESEGSAFWGTEDLDNVTLEEVADDDETVEE